jgi:hypothetical protein
MRARWSSTSSIVTAWSNGRALAGPSFNVEANEALFREVNERIWETDASFAAPGDEPSRYLEFLCECGRLDCIEHIELTAPEYESVRAEPDQFALAPGTMTAVSSA